MHLILFFTFDYSLLTWSESGYLTREMKLYNYLISKGVKVSFVTFGDEKDLDILHDSKINIVPIYSIVDKSKFKVINIIKSFFIPWKLINRLDTKSKKIIVKQNQLLGSWVSIIFNSLIKSKLYTRTGYDMYQFSIKDMKSLHKRFMYYMLTQLTILFSDKYSVTSNSDLNFLKKRFFGTKNILIRPNWVEEGMINPKKQITSTLLSVGRLEKQKNFQDLLLSIKDTGFKLDIYGEGSLKEELINLSNQLGVDLKIFNNIENKELLNVYKKYKYFISSSSFEGNSKVILEAMANGCITIVKDIENNREIIENQESGILYTDDLKQVLLGLKDGAYENINFSLNAKNRIENNYSKDKVFANYFSDFVNLYNS